MKLIIDIPNSLYANLQRIDRHSIASARILDCFKNGTPLSAEGEYIKKEDAINLTWREPTYTDPLNVLTEVRDGLNELPTYSFPDKENDYMKAVRRDCGL